MLLVSGWTGVVGEGAERNVISFRMNGVSGGG